MKVPSNYQSLVSSAASANGVPAGLVAAVIQQESAWQPEAGSSAGARGLMQLMPATARSLGVTDITDVNQNVNAGTKYLSQMLNQFGNTEVALAAYNAGPGRVGGLVKKYGNSIDAIYPHLPKETQNYVKKVMGYYQ